MFTILPTELALSILLYLSIPDIHVVQLISKAHLELIRSNESEIYRNAAAFHGFLPSTQVAINKLTGLGIPEKNFEGIESWRLLCQRMFQLNKNWRGNGPSELICFESPGENPLFVKVNETDDLLFGINEISRLIVADKQDKRLWSQGFSFGRYKKLEYQSGYLVFNNEESGYKEVWRLATIPDPFPPSTADTKDLPYAQPAQVESSKEAYRRRRRTYPKGHFIPHAAIPHSGRCPFKLVFPALVILESDSMAHIYSVPSRTLIQTVSLHSYGHRESISDLECITAIDMNESHIFLCEFRTGMRVFERDTGLCVLDMPGNRYSYALRKIKVIPSDHYDPASMKGVVVPVSTVEVPGDSGPVLLLDDIRVSACGNHFVAITTSDEFDNSAHGFCQLVVVRNFKNIPLGDAGELAKHAIQIDLDKWSGKLAFDGCRRVLVVTKGSSNPSVLIVDISEFLSTSGAPQVYVVPEFRYGDRLMTTEITETGIYFDWDANSVVWDKWDKRNKLRDAVRNHGPEMSTIWGVNFAVWD